MQWWSEMIKYKKIKSGETVIIKRRLIRNLINYLIIKSYILYPVTCRGELKFLTSIVELSRLTVILSIAISLICIILFRTDSTNIAKTYLKLFDFNYDLQFFAGKFASPVGNAREVRCLQQPSNICSFSKEIVSGQHQENYFHQWSVEYLNEIRSTTRAGQGPVYLSIFKITIYARFWCSVKLATHSAKLMTYRRSISHDIFSFEW